MRDADVQAFEIARLERMLLSAGRVEEPHGLAANASTNTDRPK